jgi:hypothetical protein
MVIKMKKLIAIMIIALMLATVFGTFSAANASEINNDLILNNTVERWAVIVGADIDVYAPYDAWDLNNTLVNHGWQTDHIKVLTFLDAKKENIINAIRWMESKEDEDDIVLFFFAGHGRYQKIKTIRSDEYITCEELNNEFDNFESNSMVIIFNCCFSGSMVSSPFGSSESIQEEQIEELYDNNNVIGFDGSVEFMPEANTENEQISLEETGLESSGFDGLDNPGRVILMSSRRFELSYAHLFLRNGIFSYFLVEGFEGNADDANQDGWISAEEAFEYARPRTTWLTRLHLKRQHPQIYDGYEGELNIVQSSSQQNDQFQDQKLTEGSQQSTSQSSQVQGHSTPLILGGQSNNC